MKLLKVDSSLGYFALSDGSYRTIDKLSKDDLLRLVQATLQIDEFELDDPSDNAIQNQAHQVIYKSVHRKLLALRARKQEFTDAAARLYLEDYERYKNS